MKKLVIAIVNNDDSAIVTSAITKEGFFCTKLSTTGGFLMVGNTTLLIGVEEDQVPRIRELLAQYCCTRRQVNPTTASFGRDLRNNEIPSDVNVGGATFFVLSIEEFGKV